MVRHWLEAALLQVWYGPHRRWLGALLWPLGLLVWVYLRWRPAPIPQPLPVPLVVVGNLTVGGTGKTPLTRALVRALQQRGWHPAVVSRGYGGRVRAPHGVQRGDDPAWVGDEPLLLAEEGCPVWVGRDRVAAGRGLLAAHPEVNVLLCDDGLQHRPLAPQVSLVVVDGRRGWGNGRLLPAGPLREPLSRLAQVDEVVINRGFDEPLARLPQGITTFHGMTLMPLAWISLSDEQQQRPVHDFAGQSCVALAGIGHPARFFDQLRVWGITAQCLTFADHHRYGLTDLPDLEGRPLLMTEKDAIKWRHLSPKGAWYLRIIAQVEDDLIDRVVHRLTRYPTSPAVRAGEDVIIKEGNCG